MAAKPTKPPGNFLKSLINQTNNNKTQQLNNNEDVDSREESKNTKQYILQASASTTNTTATTTSAAPLTKRTNCNCSNISIMHLFHEMKQDFPTIPDTIVAQCVNENCHQRQNCIQMLKNELELNPVPAQSYPAKVLHPPNNNILQNATNNNNTTATTTTTPPTALQKPPLQQKPLLLQQKPPLKPIKPIRTAPLQPPKQQQPYSKNISTKINSTLSKNTSITTATTTTTKPLAGVDLANNENVCNSSDGAEGPVEANNMPTKITTNNANVNPISPEVCNNDDKVYVGVGGECTERNLPRQRPTTLNLNTQLQKQQQQQRQRLNIQLQQRFQEQRYRQQQQQHQQQQQQSQIATTTLTKPIRKAPLPPIAPKPSQFQLNQTNTNVVNNSQLNDSHLASHTTTSPQSESEISVSVSLSTPSPSPSSSLSPNTTIHHTYNKPSQTPNTTTTNPHHLQTKSPIRHRSVINLQPEPPYTRDFLFTNPAPLPYASSAPASPSDIASTTTTTRQTAANTSSSSSTSSPTTSAASSQKSFTSVNLTLRPPVSPNGSNTNLQPSTIDITAGPGFSAASGAGKSLHYSSTSYDARLGYQQNFQITVTDECGVFSASRIRPQQQQQHLQQRGLNQVNIIKANQTNPNNFVNSFLCAPKQQQQQLQLQLRQQQQQQFHNNNVVALQQNIQNNIQPFPDITGALNTSSASSTPSGLGGASPYAGGNMCLPPQQAMDAPTQEILQRQKKKRDKLAAALREYKKRLLNVEQEINLLTGAIPLQGMSERLDEEIIKLRRDCQDMLRSSNAFTQPPSQQELAINHQPQRPTYQQHQQAQSFPRQRITRPPQRSPPAPRQTSLDIIQHHSLTSTPYTSPVAASLPNLNLYNTPQQQQPYYQNTNLTAPAYYHQQSSPTTANFVNNNDFYTDHYSNYIVDQDLAEDEGDDYGDEYEEEEAVEPWECNMCTFRNHPQLNICETCENVRIVSAPVLSREDIQITLSPGENRIIHSWIVS